MLRPARQGRTGGFVLPLVGALALAVAAVTCGGSPTDDDGPDPVAGELLLTVSSPNGPEGAAVLDMDASAVASAASDSLVVHTTVVGDRLRVVLLRQRAGELSARLSVVDIDAPLNVRILQVADSANALRNLQGYTAVVR